MCIHGVKVIVPEAIEALIQAASIAQFAPLETLLRMVNYLQVGSGRAGEVARKDFLYGWVHQNFSDRLFTIQMWTLSDGINGPDSERL
uniref:Dymeclin n=1 Tax=Steinernema glaseri TaxID=37863 RepID=A0A1I7ZCR3_9BILA